MSEEAMKDKRSVDSPVHAGTLHYERRRGVVYFFDEKTGMCLLRIEGVPSMNEGEQIDIHLVEPGLEHHHTNCGNRALVMKEAPWDDGSVCAVKLPKSSRGS